MYGGGVGDGYKAPGSRKAWTYIRGSGIKLSDTHVGIVDEGLYAPGEGAESEFGGDVKIDFPDPARRAPQRADGLARQEERGRFARDRRGDDHRRRPRQRRTGGCRRASRQEAHDLDDRLQQGAVRQRGDRAGSHRPHQGRACTTARRTRWATSSRSRRRSSPAPASSTARGVPTCARPTSRTPTSASSRRWPPTTPTSRSCARPATAAGRSTTARASRAATTSPT